MSDTLEEKTPEATGGQPDDVNGSVGDLMDSPIVESSVPDQDTTGSVQPDQVTLAAGIQSVTLDALTSPHVFDLEGFDPAIHATNPDGSPRRKDDGTLAKKRGRRAGSSDRAPYALPRADAPIGGGVPSTGGEKTKAITPDDAAKISANMVFNLGALIFGPELAAPQSKAEADAMKVAFRDYYAASGVPDIPPSIGLALAIGLYGFGRMQHESMKPKRESWWAAIKRFFRKDNAQVPKPAAKNATTQSAAPNLHPVDNASSIINNR